MSISKYLARYAEVEPARTVCDGNYEQVLVVPLFDELPATADPSAANCLDRMFAQIAPKLASKVLTIAVVNAPDNCPPDAAQRTKQLLASLTGRSHTLVVDRVSPGVRLPHKKGVGLARKIGSDLATRLIHAQHIRSAWIYQTDADVVLPENYFCTAMPARGAVVFAHHHVSTDSLTARAAHLYDQHMTYYVNGLAAAGSDYAFPTLGSTIAIHADTYAQVRGYPQRNAGEDFYLLNKAAKVAPVTSKPEVNISIQARLSQRVPFGTGPALKKISQLLQTCPDGSSYLSYHPDTFTLLGLALKFLQDFGAASTPRQPQNARLATLLDKIGFAPIAANLHHKYSNPTQRARMLRQWFDGFRQLRFVHEARHIYPDQPLLQSLGEVDFATSGQCG